MKRKRQNPPGAGRDFLFHGSFVKKSDAVAKEQALKAKGVPAFIMFRGTQQGFRYLVAEPKTAPNPGGHKLSSPAERKRALRALSTTACTLKSSHALAAALRNYHKRTGHKANPSIIKKLKKALGLERTTKTYRMPLYRKQTDSERARAAGKFDDELYSALRGLGYKAPVARQMTRKAKGSNFDEKLRDALRKDNPSRAKRKKKRNPQPASPSARRLYRQFHGAESRHTARVAKTTFPGPSDLTKLGDLAELFTLSDCEQYVGQFSFRSSQPAVASNPEGTQIYFQGGNQNVDTAVPRWAGRTNKDLIDLGRCYHIRYFTRKKLDGFQPTIYAHPFGREQGKQSLSGVPTPYAEYEPGELPRLQYDRYRKVLLLVGGKYRARPEGIVD